jgi:hypothetical protein
MVTILKIVERKFFEEGLAAYYWAQPPHVQQAFVRAYGRLAPSGDGDMRNVISDIVAQMVDADLEALTQAVVHACM